MGVGQLSESDAVDDLRLPFYSSSHPTGSHGWRNQFDLGNPDRMEHQEALDELLTQIVATLMAENLVTLEEVAQDGVRVRASAGSGSFRRKARLEECLEAAQARVEWLALEREHPDPGVSRRERAGRERAAQERLERVEHTLGQLSEVQAAKERQARHAGRARQARLREARVSITDPEARVMKTNASPISQCYPT